MMSTDSSTNPVRTPSALPSGTQNGPPRRFGLGIDQGVASIGWAVLELDDAGNARRIERLGVHLFEAGTEGDIAGGRDESRAGPRRMARAMRRQYRRRCLRKRRLLLELQRLGLMPPGEVGTPEGREALLRAVDAELRARWEVGADHRTRQLLPYRLRAEGLTQRLEPVEFGRALYHLAQRRGYLSNRKADAPSPAAGSDDQAQEKGGEDSGVVRAGIIELRRQMEGAGCRTLAEYFCRLDPTGRLEDRLRGRWTGREMFLEEFNRLWDEQKKHHPALTDEARARVWKAIFYQRPLRGAAHLIGRCELVPGQKRAPLGCLLAQRFRLLAAVNNLEIELPDYSRRRLTPQERDRLIAALETSGDIPFSKLKQKQWFGLPRGSTFNLERGGNKKLPGNRTAARCREIFGDERWDAMSPEQQDAVVQDLLVYIKPKALEKRGRTVYGLDAERAERFGDTVLEQGYAAFSREALRRLLPRLERGEPLQTAIRAEFQRGDGEVRPALDRLPPVESVLGNVRNPAVTRALTELRKLVNAVVGRYGKPEWIRIELARDLKRARDLREKISRENRERQGARERARERLLQEAGIQMPSRADVERVLLAEECGWICPYTGRSFGIRDIVGSSPQFDVEHIWPLSRSLDDSFLNKTICHVQENRQVKGNRTPFEAYGGTPRWEQILDRVRRFSGDAARIKLERFQAESIPEGFAERHLAETRKIGAATQEYLMTLYGSGGHANNPGVAYDASGRQRLFTVAGGLTHHLRREWQLSAVLSGEDVKSRDDHRHHALDALVVALTTPAAVAMLQRAAERAGEVGRRLFARVDPPWESFLREAAEAVQAINVSFRQSRRIRGKLHAESNYSRPIGPDGQRRIRKELAKLTEKDVERIADPRIRQAVKDRIAELGLKPKGSPPVYGGFADRATHPFTTTADGRRVWIHKVRLIDNVNPRAVGRGGATRYVGSTQGSNHHTVIARAPDGTWTDTPVPLLDLKPSRTGTGRCPHGGDRFTLAANEYVLMKDDQGQENLYRVENVSKGSIGIVLHTDGRSRDVRGKDWIRIRSIQKFIERGARKVTVTYLGEIRRAGG
jgi:CRISPR-associated endonuclease Csn1